MKRAVIPVKSGQEDPAIHNAGGRPSRQNFRLPEKIRIIIEMNWRVSILRGDP